MEMYAVVEKWVNEMNSSDRATMLEGLSKAGVRAGRNHDAKRNDGMGAHGGHSHGPPKMTGYMQQAQTKIPGYQYYQQAQGMVGQAQGMMGGHGGGHVSHGGAGGYVQQAGGYVQQAQHLFQGGGSGVGGFVQNFARREVDDEPDYAPPREEPRDRQDYRDDDLDESRDRPRRQHQEQYDQPHPGHGRPEPPYPQTPTGFREDYEEPLPGQTPGYGRPPPPGLYGQFPYGGQPRLGDQPPFGYHGNNGPY